MTAAFARLRRIYRAPLHFAGLLSVASAAMAEEPPKAPPPASAPAADLDVPPSSARTNHLIGGAAMTVGWYGFGAGTAALWPDAPGSDELLIPIAGPFMSLAETGCPDNDPDCSVVIVIIQAVMTTLSGVGQVGGLGIVGEGLFMETRDTKSASAEPVVSAQVTPVVSDDRIGLGVVGRF